MSTSIGQVLRDALARVVDALSDRAGSHPGGDTIDVPDLASVDDTPSGRRGVHLPSRTDDPPADDDALAVDPARDRRRMARDADGQPSPGQVGPDATVEVDRRELLFAEIAYNPDLDGDPDPGEVIWTWVPYREADGRGKDRPVLVLAREEAGTLLGVYLSSRPHGGDSGWARLGAGGWDSSGRESWANLDRVLRIHPDGMRREGDRAARVDFDRIVHRLGGMR